MDRLIVNFGSEYLKIIPGRISTEVDARLSFDTEGTIAKALKLIKMYQDMNIPAQLSYDGLPGLTRELQNKLAHFRPQSIAQAQLIPGITPAAISILIFQTRNLGRTLDKKQRRLDRLQESLTNPGDRMLEEDLPGC